MLNLVRNDRVPVVIFLLTLVLALALYTWPIRSDLSFWRPPFVLLLLTYWIFSEPQRFGVIIAWVLGLLMDFLFGSVFGQHALAMSVAAYLVILQRHRLQHFTVVHQSIFVAVVVAVYQLVLLSARALVDEVTVFLPMFYSALASAVLWPFWFAAMRKLHGR